MRVFRSYGKSLLALYHYFHRNQAFSCLFLVDLKILIYYHENASQTLCVVVLELQSQFFCLRYRSPRKVLNRLPLAPQRQYHFANKVLKIFYAFLEFTSTISIPINKIFFCVFKISYFAVAI
jgi:hypothetical protein